MTTFPQKPSKQDLTWLMDLKVLKKNNFFDLSRSSLFSPTLPRLFWNMARNQNIFHFDKNLFLFKVKHAKITLSKIFIPYFELVYNQKYKPWVTSNLQTLLNGISWFTTQETWGLMENSRIKNLDIPVSDILFCSRN